MRPSRILSGALACALLLGACNDSADPEPPPLPDDAQNEPDGDDEDTESDEIDVSTVPADPDDIDEEYVQAVMDEIDPIIRAGAAVLATVQDVEDPNVLELYTAAYETEAARRHLGQYTAGVGPEGLREEPGNIETEVLNVVVATQDCILATANRDFLPLFEDPEAFKATQPYHIRLQPREPDDLNSTAWHLSFDSFVEDDDDVAALEAVACE